MTNFKKLLLLALPISLQNLVNSSLAIIDQLFISNLGNSAFVGVGVATKLFGIFMFFMFGVGGALTIFLTQLVGKNEYDKSKVYINLSMYISLGVALFFLLGSYIFANNFMRLFSNDLEVISYGSQYLKASSVLYLLFVPISIYSADLRSRKNTKYPLVIGVISAIINTVLNYLTLFYLNMGLLGIVYSTIIARVVEGSFLYWKYYQDNKDTKPIYHKLNKHIIYGYLVIMLPLVFNNITFILADTVYYSYYSNLGINEALSVSIVFPLQGWIITLLGGFSAASLIILGDKIGSKTSLKKVNQEALNILKFAFIISFVIVVIAYLISPMYIRLFNVKEELVPSIMLLMMLVLFFVPFKITNMIIYGGILSSGGQTKFLFKLTLICTWVIGVPLGFIFSKIYFISLTILFVAISVEEIIRVIAGVYKIMKTNWIKNIV